MVRDPFREDSPPDLQSIIGALDDVGCREIISRLDEPMTANEIADATDTPLSTTYRKLDRLSEASLVAERTQIREGGHHTTQYVVNFDAVRIALDEDREFEIDVSRPAETADERLAQLWTEVRKET